MADRQLQTDEQTPTEEYLCVHCADPASDMRCGQCRAIQYCSVECQQADWRFHKLLCKDAAKFKTRPNGEVRRALLLPEHGEKPEFIWLPVNTEGVTEPPSADPDDDFGVPFGDDKAGSVMPLPGKFLGESDGDSDTVILVCGLQGSGTTLNRSIRVIVRGDKATGDPNACLSHLLGAHIAARYCGPLIIVAATKVVDSRFTLDLDVGDFTHALDGFEEEHAASMQQESDVSYNIVRKAVGMRVRKAEDGTLTFKEVEIPFRHPVFSKGTLSEVSDACGIPVRRHESKSSPKSMADAVKDPGTFNINSLGISVDPKSRDYCKMPSSIIPNDTEMLFVGPKLVALNMERFKIICKTLEDTLPAILEIPEEMRANELRTMGHLMRAVWKNAQTMSGDEIAELRSTADRLQALALTHFDEVKQQEPAPEAKGKGKGKGKAK